MSVVFSAVKYFVFAFNLLSLVLGICIACLCTLGLEWATPNTEEHTYYIVGIILGSFICLATLFGCYGVACESLGVNTIYAFFMLMLLVVQLMQMQMYKQRSFYGSALEHLENAWNSVQTEPTPMLITELRYHCCGLYNARDYSRKKLPIPANCYRHRDVARPDDLYTVGCVDAVQAAYQLAMQRESYFNWALLIAEIDGTECVVFTYSSILSALLWRQYRRRNAHEQPVAGYVEQPRSNHVNSLYQNAE